ncbi:class IV adenylate cyclase [Streptomyces sp. NPDC002643]
MIEAELKARVRSPEAVMRRLDECGEARVEVYRDTYYERPDGSLGGAGQELRLRTVHEADGTKAVRTVLTFKDAAVDEDSGSKPEYETRVDDADAAHAILLALGHVESIAFDKRCRNHSFEAYGRRMSATLVQVPEIDGTFLEIETLVHEGDVSEALNDVRAVFTTLGISPEDLTRDTYTDAVRSARGHAGT